MTQYKKALLGKTGEKGFTMIEIMVVVVIIGLLAGIIGPRIIGNTDKAKVTKAKVTISNIESALKMYKLDNGFYPTSDQGLKALIQAPQNGKVPQNYQEGGYLEKRSVPKDPWESEFVYRCPGQNGDFDLISYGPDGVEGGGDDITNWESSESSEG